MEIQYSSLLFHFLFLSLKQKYGLFIIKKTVKSIYIPMQSVIGTIALSSIISTSSKNLITQTMYFILFIYDDYSNNP